MKKILNNIVMSKNDDAQFSLFKVMVTNADGSQTAKTLTELGITSINLKADLTHVAYADGSAITGQTTFTKADGTTGTVANTTLAADAHGYALTTTTSTDASGTVTLSHTGYGADGSIAFVETSATSADGHNISTSYDDNGDGVVDRIQVITTTVDATGTRTELLSTYNGGLVLRNRLQTVSNADGSVVTLNRDTTGGGWFNQSEQRVTYADGHRDVTLTNLNADGSGCVAANDNYSTSVWVRVA